MQTTLIREKKRSAKTLLLWYVQLCDSITLVEAFVSSLVVYYTIDNVILIFHCFVKTGDPLESSLILSSKAGSIQQFVDLTHI